MTGSVARDRTSRLGSPASATPYFANGEPLGLTLDVVLDLLAERIITRLSPVLEQQPATPPEPWRLLTMEEAGARLGRSARWIRQRAKDGQLPYVRLDGGSFGFLVDDLEAFARARRVSADGPLEELNPLAERLQATRKPASRNGSRGSDAVAKPEGATVSDRVEFTVGELAERLRVSGEKTTRTRVHAQLVAFANRGIARQLDGEGWALTGEAA